MRKTLLVLLACALVPGGAYAGDFSSSAIGTTGAQFLTMDVGARGIGLGGAYTAVTNDANSLYWNPAGLAKIPRVSASFMYTRYVEDVTYQSGSYAQRLNDTAVIAAGFRYQDLGSITHTDTSDNDLGKFHPRNYVGELGWGQSVYDLSDSEVDIDVGASVRWIHSDLLEHADGYAGDLGVQSRFYSGRIPFDMAFVAQNMGMGQKFDIKRDTLPFRAKLGGAIHPVRGLMLSLDAVMPIDNTPYGALGGEYSLEVQKNIKMMLRGGFNGMNVNDLGVVSAISFGMGLSVSDITFDYGFSPLGALGNQVHRFSVSFNLPAKVSRRYRER